MAAPPASLDYWRKFFRSANSDIFDVVDQAILVAASDCPDEFRSRRDQIAVKLYTALLPRCYGCGGVDLRPSDGEEEGGGSVKGDDVEKVPEGLRRGVSNYSYDEAEALTEEIEEESQIVGEVLRIKEILANKQDQSDGVLFESLRRLQLMELSVETLKATEIGRAVNGLRKHNSKQIRHVVRILIEDWKVLVDEFVSATAAIADKTPDSVNPSVVDDEEGLPSPPLDEGAFLATQTTSIQLSGFFDGMDDDGNLRNYGDYNKRRENDRRAPINQEQVRRQQPPLASISPEKNEGQMRRQEQPMRKTKPQEPFGMQPRPQGISSRQIRPANTESGPGRPSKPAPGQKLSGEMRPKQAQGLTTGQRKHPMVQMDKSKHSEEASVQAKLELAKRKLHEGYQQAENAKKQRTVQVMELHDIPKQANRNRQSLMKPRNQIRSWANGRH